jgi:hypothetical protein
VGEWGVPIRGYLIDAARAEVRRLIGSSVGKLSNDFAHAVIAFIDAHRHHSSFYLGSAGLCRPPSILAPRKSL